MAARKPAAKMPARTTDREKPAARKPAPKEPVTRKPAPKEPVTRKPAPKEPVTRKPAPKEPVTRKPAPKEPAYAAPALEKGLDILELLSRSERPVSQTQIAQGVGRSVGEIYRMLACLVSRNYIVQIGDSYACTTRLFELAHENPPMHRLLVEAAPIMQRLSSELDQSCHLTVYNVGRQVVIAKVDSPSGMGFSLRVGAELDVLVSASGRVLLAFQTPETRKLRIEEALARRPAQAEARIAQILDSINACGFASFASVQVRGLYAVSFPVLDSQGHAIAALTVPYAERIDQPRRKRVPEIENALGASARMLTERIGGIAAARNLPSRSALVL